MMSKLYDVIRDCTVTIRVESGDLYTYHLMKGDELEVQAPSVVTGPTDGLKERMAHGGE